ncbi:MAG: sugar phosphate isomerase/epimerase [Patescibacteria group bacterium]|nr:sugar phosphate isomerase/epimerase [Patescibacteria group bacterium]
MRNNKMKILISSISATPSPFYLLREMASRKFSSLKFLQKKNKALKELNSKYWEESLYDGLELNFPGLGFFDRNWNIRKERIIEYKRSNYPFYSFHGCFDSFPKNFRGLYFNLAASDNYIPKALKSQIDVAARLSKDTPILVLHPGFADRCSKERALDNLLFNLEGALPYARRRNVILTLENMNWNPTRKNLGYLADDFDYIFRRLDDSNLKVTFDIGHMNTQVLNRKFRVSHDIEHLSHISEFIERMSKRIVHAHLHYNNCHNSFDNVQELLKRSITKWFYLGFMLWMKINRSMITNQSDLLDEHLPLNKADKMTMDAIKNLLDKTAIKEYGKLTFEFTPKKIFKFVAMKNGADMNDHMKSLEIMRNLMSPKILNS